MKKKIILDTDIGSDVDDALALAYLIQNPICELMGITTVTGESSKRAMVARAICNAFNKTVPIFPGADNPIIIEQMQQKAPEAEILTKYEHNETFPKYEAVQFLQKTIRDNPHEITLLTIGALTNIATLFLLDPEIPSLLNGLVMMSGIFKNQFASYEQWSVPEWNTRVDPHASAIVYNLCSEKNKIIGLDTTGQVYFHADRVKKELLPILPKIFTDLVNVWFREREYITFHDPLAATTIFNENICQFDKKSIEIELLSEKLKGMTIVNNKSGNLKHNIAVKVNPELFFKEYTSVFS